MLQCVREGNARLWVSGYVRVIRIGMSVSCSEISVRNCGLACWSLASWLKLPSFAPAFHVSPGDALPVSTQVSLDRVTRW